MMQTLFISSFNRYTSSWWEWRDRIYGIDPNNPTRDNLTELFNNW